MARKHGQRKAHQQRDDLAGEHAMGDAGQLVVACLFAATWIADSFFFKYTTFLNEIVPPLARVPCGIVLLVLSGYPAKTGLSIVFGEERDPPGVIRESVFNVVRYRIYLSEILFYLGLLMLSMSLAAAVVWIVAIGFFHYISLCEERMLVARFGQEYEEYMRKVPMWIPRLRKR